MLPENVYKELEDILGAENVTQEPAILDSYAWQPALNLLKDAWVPRPEAVVLPQTTAEVQAIVQLCNRAGIKCKAFSSGWASYSACGSEGVIQIDLRRMNRIIEIDEKNMIAVIEPYVCGSQLQAECMKRGLNCHIIGAGPNCSPLASLTSGWGYGWTGLYTSYSNRNPLAVEWVLPNGELLQMGSLGSGCGWINGDGPGPSLRGVMRGWGGAQGGLGVFTKCAVKLYPWPGEEGAPKGMRGMMLDLDMETPKLHKLYYIYSPSYAMYAEFAHRIANSEIGYIHCKLTTGGFMSVLMPRAIKKIMKSKAIRAAAKALQHCTSIALACHSEREFVYQEEVLRKIVEETDSFIFDWSKLAPRLHDTLLWLFHRSIPPAMIFRVGGNFLTSFGANEMYDMCVLGCEAGEQLKRPYIDKGIFIEDTGDNTWGGIYEGSSGWGHIEECAMYDLRTSRNPEARFDYLDETVKVVQEKTLGFSLASVGGDSYKYLGPLMYNYHLWQSKIKSAFDPNYASDASFYIPPYEEVVKIMEQEDKGRMFGATRSES